MDGALTFTMSVLIAAKLLSGVARILGKGGLTVGRKAPENFFFQLSARARPPN